MSKFPLSVELHHGDHQGGTKSYTVLLLACADGTGILINRYGKIGAAGQSSFDMTQNTSVTETRRLDKAYQKKVSDKISGGYDLRPFSVRTCPDEAQLQQFLVHHLGRAVAAMIMGLPQLRAELGSGPASTPMPINSKSESWTEQQRRAAREKEERMAQERDKLAHATRLHNEREAEERQARQKAEDDARMASNPLWGRF